MKHMKNWAALLLTVCMLLSLCACGADMPTKQPAIEESDTPTQELMPYGTWKTELPVNKVLELTIFYAGLSCEIAEPVMLTLYMELREDGTCSVTADEASVEAMKKAAIDTIHEAVPEMLYAQFESDHGWGRDELDEQLALQYMTFEDVVEMTLSTMGTEEDYDCSGLFTGEGYFTVEDGKLRFAQTSEDLSKGNYAASSTFFLEGDELRITDKQMPDADASEWDACIEYPVVYTKTECESET